MSRICVNGSLYAHNGARKYLNGDERRRFMAAARLATPEIGTLCLTLALTGCRISEALGLMARDIQVKDGLIAVRCLKKRDKFVMREIPVPTELIAELERVHYLRRDGGADRLLWPWGRTRAWSAVKEVMAAAGITHLAASPKGLRHGFGVNAVCSGVPLNLVQRWLGHEDIATTAIYAAALGPEERAIAERMW